MKKVWAARKGRTVAGSALVALGLTTATTGMVFAAGSAAADDPSPAGEGLVEVADPDDAVEVEAVVSEKKDAEKKAPADDKGGDEGGNKSDDKKNDQSGDKKEDKPGKGGEKEDKGGKPDKSPGNPPGNNGTVKIAELGDLDEIPNNQPHQGCVFTVQWYNFDEGEDIISQVTFEAWAPTKVPMTVNGPSSVFVGEDPASGAGNDFDGEVVYTLDFDGEPHPQQGYHVKLTVNTPGSIGADKKSKVFWVEGCEDETATPTPSETTSTSPSETATSPSETATSPSETATSPSETATSPSETATSPSEDLTSPSETDTTDTTPTVNPSSSTAPPATNPGGKTPPGQQPDSEPTVKGVEAQAPAAVPTSVDAGLAPAQDDSGRNLAMMVLGMLLAVAGAVFGFTPAPTRGKFKH